MLAPLTLQGSPGVPGAGSLIIPGADVSSYGALTLYLQGSFLDAGHPLGLTLSNAIQMSVVP
jgi:hypothetical protein